MKLYRGEHVGVFSGANGYYVAVMAEDGVSHYQPANQGCGWDDMILRECNREAREIERDIREEKGTER